MRQVDGNSPDPAMLCYPARQQRNSEKSGIGNDPGKETLTLRPK